MIGGIEPFTLIDYPGLPAATIFFVGCPWRCWYCHNKDIVLGRISKEISWDNILKYLQMRVSLLHGVVLSGGEPLMNDIEKYILDIKRLGYKVKIDTNGAYPNKLEQLLQKNIIDYVAMDIKAPFNLYPSIIGCEWPIDYIKKSIHLLKNSGIPHQFRVTYDDSMGFTIDMISELVGEEVIVQKYNSKYVGSW